MVPKTRPFVVTILNSKKITRDRHKFWQKYCNSIIYNFGCALHLAAFKSEELSLASYEMRLTKYLFNNQNYIFGCSIVFYVLTGFNWRQSAVSKTKSVGVWRMCNYFSYLPQQKTGKSNDKTAHRTPLITPTSTYCAAFKRLKQRTKSLLSFENYCRKAYICLTLFSGIVWPFDQFCLKKT